jgi:acetyltransferase
MKGRKVAVISNAGGPAVMTADAIDKTSLKLAKFSPKVEKVLEESLPFEAATSNPVDVLGDALSDRYSLAIGETLKDANVDAVLVLLTPQVMTEVEKTARIIIDAKKHGKPVIACFMGGTRIEKAVGLLEENKVAVYDFPERAVKALDVLYKYHEFRKKIKGKNERVEHGNYKKYKAAKIINDASQKKSRNVSQGEDGVFDVFDAYGIETVNRAYSANWGQLKEGAIKVGYPAVLKTSVSSVLHRTEVGGVVIGIEDKKALAKAYNDIKKNISKVLPHENSQEMTVYKMETGGVEIFLGAKRDSGFGPVIVFGMGGIYVETLRDLSYRIAPVSRVESLEMIDEIKSSKMLHGFRGTPKCDIDKVSKAIMGLSQLMLDSPEIKEIDINPLKVTDKKCVAVDGKIILDL